MDAEQYSMLIEGFDGKPWSEIPIEVLKQILRYYMLHMDHYGTRVPAINEELAKRGERK